MQIIELINREFDCEGHENYSCDPSCSPGCMPWCSPNESDSCTPWCEPTYDP